MKPLYQTATTIGLIMKFLKRKEIYVVLLLVIASTITGMGFAEFFDFSGGNFDPGLTYSPEKDS